MVPRMDKRNRRGQALGEYLLIVSLGMLVLLGVSAVFLDKVAEQLKLAKVGETRAPAAVMSSNAAPPAAPVRVVGGAMK